MLGKIQFAQRLRSFLCDRSGNVLILSALSLPVLVGAAALVAEYGDALLDQVENQRVADMASFAGALAYNSTKSETTMTSAAQNVAKLNGVPASDVSVNLVPSPRTTGAKAVTVEIETQKPLFLARVLDTRTSVDISAQAWAEVGGKATPGCVLALDPTQTGVTLSGGTKIEAPNCTVSSNNTVTVPCGTYIKAIGVNYNSAAAPSAPCGGITNATGGAAIIAKQATADPLKDNTGVTGAVARITTVAAMATPTITTTTTGQNIDFAWSQSSTQTAAAAVPGCSASWASGTSTWTLTCTGKSSYNFGNITMGGGIKLNFNTAGPSTAVYNFSGTINNTGTSMTFGPGTFNIAKGLTTGGGSTTTFGAGTFNIGKSDTACSGSGNYSICNTSTLTFGGPSTFVLPAGFSNTGGSTLTFGAGTTNSFKLGPSSTGNAVNLGGGSKTFMYDALGASSVFEVKGHINGGGGGSCFMVPAAAQHDISGNFIASGAMVLGSGVYTVDGYFSLGANGGGSAACPTATVSVKALGVTLVLSGKNVPNGGSCNGYSFCVAAGYSNIQLEAPTSGATAKLAVIGPTSSTVTAGATFAEGGSNAQISGAFYFPKGPITMSGGSSTFGSKTDTTKCLQLIGSRITLSGGTAAASECIAASGATGSDKVSLVQ
jgi:Flp pilus assembly protein TadG